MPRECLVDDGHVLVIGQATEIAAAQERNSKTLEKSGTHAVNICIDPFLSPRLAILGIDVAAGPSDAERKAVDEAHGPDPWHAAPRGPNYGSV